MQSRLTLQPDFLIASDLRGGRIVKVMLDWRAAEFEIQTTYPTRRQLVRRPVDFLGEALREPRGARKPAER